MLRFSVARLPTSKAQRQTCLLLMQNANEILSDGAPPMEENTINMATLSGKVILGFIATACYDCYSMISQII